MSQEFTFEATVWLYGGKSAWHFVTLPRAVAAEIIGGVMGSRKPFGSVKVLAILGGTRWNTSLFRDTNKDSFLLPIKAAVRLREQIQAGMRVEVSLLLHQAVDSRKSDNKAWHKTRSQ
jgi:hypothetical protein